ncbi:MFS transporter [Saccharothrix yanglingensis]|uniref:MFS transporter n=1 Tax=Saccharothrix yanglingensis TaxID=659496 RepID=A0ABU0X898_9PSEU|nr:MFS transporter [Saccharothrix yanglingensis]MDQ2587928.1 hypothetical protein [Saccharothrix yanglingensis]
MVFATTEAGLPLTQILPVLGVAPLVEVVLIPICGVAAARWGSDRVVLGGCVASGAGMTLLAHVNQVWQLALLQVLGAFAVACLVSVGMAAVQERFPSRMRSASVSSSLPVRSPVCSATAQAASWEAPSVFAGCSTPQPCSFIAAGLCILAVAHLRQPVHQKS